MTIDHFIQLSLALCQFLCSQVTRAETLVNPIVAITWNNGAVALGVLLLVYQAHGMYNQIARKLV